MTNYDCNYLTSYMTSYLTRYVTSYVTSYLTSFLKSYLTSCVKSYLTSYVTSYLTSYVASDVTRLLTSYFTVLKIGLENTAIGLRPRAAFSRPRWQFLTIRTDPKATNNLFIFFLTLSNRFFHSFISTRTNTPRFANAALQTKGQKRT